MTSASTAALHMYVLRLGRVGTMKRPANRGYLRYYRSDIAVAERCVHRLG
jgi:hypothetical protein